MITKNPNKDIGTKLAKEELKEWSRTEAKECLLILNKLRTEGIEGLEARIEALENIIKN